MIQLPGYDITQVLGKGGMATVYLGCQLSLKRPVAIKVLSTTLCSEPLVQSQFKQESQLVASLNHPNIIQVIDQGLIGLVQPYFVMQYVKSIPLTWVIQRNDVSFTRKMDITIQICKALSYAHRNGVVHRDIKPANVLVDYEGHVRVVDFGIAGFFMQSESSTNIKSQNSQAVVMGTPAYMAPEQYNPSKKITHLSDIYSLGVLMHELFLGKRPSEDNPERGNIPELLYQVIMKCINKKPELRPQSVDAISQSLLLVAKGQHLLSGCKKASAYNDIPSQYILMDVLKENNFGATYLVKDPVKERWLVVKKQALKYQGNAYKSSKILSTLDHPHVISIYGTSRNERVFISVMEYLEKGSLQDRISHAFSLKHWLLLALQVCDGLQFLHENGVVHGNLRPSNLLMLNDNHIKITDFGFNEHNEGGEFDWYQPINEYKSESTDIFSVGAVLFYLILGKALSRDSGGINNINEIDVLPHNLQKIIKRMIAVDPVNRYRSIKQVRMHLERFMAEFYPVKIAVPEVPVKALTQTKTIEHHSWYSRAVRLLIVLACIAEVIWHF